jgi:hypothetical protein
VLAREWAAAAETETLCACPVLSAKDRRMLRTVAMSLPGSQRLYGWFHRWRAAAGKASPQWAGSVPATVAAFAKHSATVAAWAGPRIRAEEQAARAVADVARAEASGPTWMDGRTPLCEPPPGGFAAVVRQLAAAKGYGGER